MYIYMLRFFISSISSQARIVWIRTHPHINLDIYMTFNVRIYKAIAYKMYGMMHSSLFPGTHIIFANQHKYIHKKRYIELHNTFSTERTMHKCDHYQQHRTQINYVLYVYGEEVFCGRTVLMNSLLMPHTWSGRL